MSKNSPETECSNILSFQPPVTKADTAGCPDRPPAASADTRLAQEGLRLCKAFFAIEDAALRASLIGVMENIGAGDSARRKCDER